MHRRLSLGAAALAVLFVSTAAVAQARGTTSRARAGTARASGAVTVRGLPLSGVVRRAPFTVDRGSMIKGRAIAARPSSWIIRPTADGRATAVARGTVFRRMSAGELVRAGAASGWVVRDIRADDAGRAIATSPGRVPRGTRIADPRPQPGVTGTARRIAPPPCIPGTSRCRAPRNPTDRPIILPAPIPVYWGWTPFGWSVAPLYAPSTIFVVDTCQEPQEPGKRKRRSILSWLYRGGRLSDFERNGWPWTTHLRSPLLSGMVAFDCQPTSSCAALEVTRGASQRWLFDVALPQLGTTTADALADVVSARLDRGEIVRLQHPDGGEFDLRPVRGQNVQAAHCSA